MTFVIDGEIDVVMELEAPTGETVWAVVEAKARLGYREVRGWGQRMHSRSESLCRLFLYKR